MSQLYIGAPLSISPPSGAPAAGTTTLNAFALWANTTGTQLSNSNITYDGDILRRAGNIRWILSTQLFYDNSANLTANLINRIFYDASGLNSISYGTDRTLWDSGAVTSVCWEIRQIFYSGGNISLDWETGTAYDNANEQSWSYLSRTAWDSLGNRSFNYQDREFLNTGGDGTAKYTDSFKAAAGNNFGVYGSVKTTIVTDSVGTSTTGGGPADLFDYEVPATIIRATPAGDRVVFDFAGSSNGSPGGSGQNINVKFGGSPIGVAFLITNFDPWGAEGYLYFDSDTGNIKYFIKFYNGRDFNCYEGSTGLTPGSPYHLRLIGDDGGGNIIYKNFAGVYWEGGS